MKKLLVGISFLAASLACAKAPVTQPSPISIPTSVSTVATEVVGDSVVRVIQHNMEMNPQLQIEILQRPDLKVAHTIVLDAIVLSDKKIMFSSGSGCFIEGVHYGDADIKIVFEYFPLKGDSQIYQCKLPVSNSGFGSFNCTVKN